MPTAAPRSPCHKIHIKDDSAQRLGHLLHFFPHRGGVTPLAHDTAPRPSPSHGVKPRAPYTAGTEPPRPPHAMRRSPPSVAPLCPDGPARLQHPPREARRPGRSCARGRQALCYFAFVVTRRRVPVPPQHPPRGQGTAAAGPPRATQRQPPCPQRARGAARPGVGHGWQGTWWPLLVARARATRCHNTLESLWAGALGHPVWGFTPCFCLSSGVRGVCGKLLGAEIFKKRVPTDGGADGEGLPRLPTRPCEESRPCPPADHHPGGASTSACPTAPCSVPTSNGSERGRDWHERPRNPLGHHWGPWGRCWGRCWWLLSAPPATRRRARDP